MCTVIARIMATVLGFPSLSKLMWNARSAMVERMSLPALGFRYAGDPEAIIFAASQACPNSSSCARARSRSI